MNSYVRLPTFWLKICIFLRNAQIYNLISVPQITRLLSGDPMISNKIDPHNGSKKERRSYGKIKNENMLKILTFIPNLYLKQQSSILWCFSRWRFEKSLLSNTFFSFISRSKLIVHTTEKKTKQNILLKIS